MRLPPLPAPRLLALALFLGTVPACRSADAGSADGEARADVRAEARRPVDRKRVAAALGAANSRVGPAVGREVSYDTGTRTLTVQFTTPGDFEVDFTDFWLRWRRNQWVAWKSFEEAGVPVDVVVVETNHTDGTGRVRVRSTAAVVERSAMQASDAAWRAQSEFAQWVTGGTEWEPVTP